MSRAAQYRAADRARRKGQWVHFIHVDLDADPVIGSLETVKALVPTTREMRGDVLRRSQAEVRIPAIFLQSKPEIGDRVEVDGASVSLASVSSDLLPEKGSRASKVSTVTREGLAVEYILELDG